MGFWLLATIFAVSAGVSYVATRQAQKQAKKASDAMRGVLLNKESNVEPIPVIYGTRRVGGTRVFISTRDETGGDPNEYLYIAHVLCEGEINAVSQIKFDDILITDARFSGLVTHNVHLGTDDQTYDSLLTEANAGWTSAHRLRGVAYIAFRIKWDQDVFSNIPDITCVVQGRKVFDPRNSTTAYSNNPALCIRDYLTNARYGKGLTSAQIDDTAFSQAATDCDEVVTFYTTGTTGKLFECNAVVQTDATLFSNIEMMLNGCRGFLPYNQGVYSLRIDKAASSVFAFDKSNIVGGIGIKGESKEDKYNRVIIKFPNYELDYEPDDAIWPDADSTEETTYLAEDGGTLLVGNFDNDTITNYYSARDLARIILLRSRNAIRVQFKTTSEALQLSVGDVVTVTHDTPAWSAKPFQVEELTMNYDGGCSVSMVEYQSGIYPYDTAIEERDYPATNLPDPFTVLPPTSLVATGSVVTNADGSVTSGIDVSWTASTDSFVTGYEITWTASGGDSETTTVVSPEYYIFNLNSGQTYTISVRSINSIGARSTALTTTGISPAVDTTAPGVPTSPSVSGAFQQIDLTWTNPTDSDFSYVEIKRSSTATEGDAVVIGTTSGTSFIDGPYTVVLTRYYWLRSVDRTGNASAWVNAGNGTTIQLGAGDFAAGIIDYNFLDTALQTTISGKADTTTLDQEVADLQADIDVKADQTSVTTIINETQDIGNTVDLVATRMLTLATTQSEQLGIVRDAGITVDPSTGAVTIQAVETLSSQTDTRFSAVEVDLDAAEAAINLKASVTYVNNAIAAAVLDSADLASLDALELKVNQAEIDIDANEAAILLKADSTTVSGINTRVNQAEIDISGNTSAIALKASQTDLSALTDRVSVAEIEIDALDAASITLTVRDTISLKDQIDKDNIRSLKDLLAAYNQRESLRTDLAYAQSSITADVTDLRVSTATARTELLALIDSNQALILSEQVARADADSALSSSIVSLTATVGTNTGNITTEQSVRADADTALGGRIDSLTLTVGQNTGAITTEAAARTSADSVLTNTGETLRARFGVSKADTYSASTTYLADDEVVYTGLLYKATQETTGNLPTNSNYWVVVETVSAAISAEVATEESARVAADEALSVTSQTLLARFGVSDQDTYNAATAYTTNDEVVYLGILYRAKGPTTGNLPTNATYWELIETVDQDLATNAGLVSTEAAARATADSALAQTNRTLFAGLNLPPGSDLYSATQTYAVGEGTVYGGAPYICIQASLNNLPTDTNYWTEITTTSGAIQENNEVRIGYCVIDGDVTDHKNKALCEAASGTWVADAAIVTAAKNIKVAKPDGTTGTITEAATAYVNELGHIEAGYGVEINNDNHVTGFSLISTAASGGGATSAFVVKADQFAIGGTGALSDSYPFVVYTTDTDVTRGGKTTTIPAGAYMDSAYFNYIDATEILVGELDADLIRIDGATIDTAEVDGNNVLKIKDLGVNSAQIADLAVTTLQIGNDAVSQIRTSTLASDVQLASGTWTELASLQFTPASVLQDDKVTSHAQPISIKGFGSFIFVTASNLLVYGSLQFRITRSGTVLKTVNVGNFLYSGSTIYGNFVGTTTPIFVDTETTVTNRTYRLEAKYTAQTGSSSTCRIEAGAVLECVEVKR
jgi:predicted phage tail protein